MESGILWSQRNGQCLWTLFVAALHPREQLALDKARVKLGTNLLWRVEKEEDYILEDYGLSDTEESEDSSDEDNLSRNSSENEDDSADDE